MTGKLSFTNNFHELPPSFLPGLSSLWTCSSSTLLLRQKLVSGLPVFVRKPCALVDPMDDGGGGGGGNSGKEECKGRLTLLIMKYGKSSIKSPVWLIYLKHV